MDDEKIVDQIWNGEERGVDALNRKYGSLMHSVAWNILTNEEDARETVNDALLQIWDAIPPSRPENLLAYACRAVRNLAINRWKFNRRHKRMNGVDVLLSELEECIPARVDITTLIEEQETAVFINTFLYLQPETARMLFIRRYFFGDGVDQLARDFNLSRQQVSDRLYQTRKKLRKYLMKEGVVV
jgi:RNA polymerase sigma-70 factor (ECF subfamily)